MVCLGNICRSPLAEGILKNKLPQDRFRVDSAGTAGYHIGHSPDLRSIEVAAHNGIDIRHQKARKFTPDDFDRFDKIFVMDRSNLANIRKMALTSDHQKKVALLLENDEVPDPYYGNEDGFKKVFELIDQACDKLSNELQKPQS
jgi:protein-tyrosine phosphatase